MTGETTQLMAGTHLRYFALVRHRLAAVAGRLSADCDRLLRSLQGPGHEAWRKAVGDAWLASRQLESLAGAEAPASADQARARISELERAIQEPRRQILDAMSVLLCVIPVTVDDELFLEDARAIRDAAAAALAAPAGALAHQNGAPVEAGAAAGANRKSHVLIVDDEPMLRDTLRRQLDRLGYAVTDAENGSDALAKAASVAPDVILTDIEMPVIDGLELLKRLKSDVQLRDIPVIVVSGNDGLESVVRCIELGAEDHIGKPYELTLLQARVRALLERKRMRDIEVGYLRRVGQITAAAEAAERDDYVPGSLAAVAKDQDALGQLARVFDRMVLGLKSREERLRRRVRRLRGDMEGVHSGSRDAARSSDSPFEADQVLSGRFRIVEQIGRGGMGTVYRTFDSELKEDIALKALRPDLVAEDKTILDRLKSEIRLSRKLSHPNVLRAHDLGESDGVYFITMEFIRGSTIGHLLDTHGRLSVESVLAIGGQLADALDAAHTQQIIHRDIKPANLLVDEQGVLKVMDFGLAKVARAESGHTLTGFVVGTPPYMSPEQMMGGTLDARSDLFATGVVLYECLVGHPPFDADNPTELLARIHTEVYPALSTVVPGLPAPLEAIIGRLLRYKAEARIQSARELADRLSDVEEQVGAAEIS